MSKAISTLGFSSVLAALTALACGSGETSRGFGEPVEGGYQAPPVAQENGSQPPNNLLACSPESGCQSCETPCDLCECRYEGDQIDENEFYLCITAPACVAALREYAGVQAGSNNGPDAQFLGGGDDVAGCAQAANDACEYCLCIDGENCSDVCQDQVPGGS